MKTLKMNGYIRISLIEVREFLRMPQLEHWDDLTDELRDKLEIRWALHQRLGHAVQITVGGLLRKTSAEEIAETVRVAEEMGD